MQRNVRVQNRMEVRGLFAKYIDCIATVHLKRLPAMPREARLVKSAGDSIETLHPIPYDTHI